MAKFYGINKTKTEFQYCYSISIKAGEQVAGTDIMAKSSQSGGRTGMLRINFVTGSAH